VGKKAECSYVATDECYEYGGMKEMVFHTKSEMLGEVHGHLEAVEASYKVSSIYGFLVMMW